MAIITYFVGNLLTARKAEGRMIANFAVMKLATVPCGTWDAVFDPVFSDFTRKPQVIL